MSNIVIGGTTYNGVNSVKFKDPVGNDVVFAENPYIVNVSEPAIEDYLGKLCKDATTGQEYIVTRGNSGSFVLKNLPGNVWVQKVKYLNGHWIIIGGIKETVNSSTVYQPVVYYSIDGNNWTRSNVGSASNSSSTYGVIDICYGGGTYLVLVDWWYNSGSTSTHYMYKYTSTDLDNWTQGTQIGSIATYPEGKIQVCYGNNIFLIGYYQYLSSNDFTYKFIYSNDAITWHDGGGFRKASYNYAYCYGLIFANGYFYTMLGSASGGAGNGSYALLRTLDGVNFETLYTTSSTYVPQYNSLYYLNNNLYYFTLVHLFIFNANTFTLVVDFWSSYSVRFYSLCFIDNVFYAGCGTGKIMKSIDYGTTWQNISFTTENYSLTSMPTDGSKILAAPTTLPSTTFFTYISSDSSNNFYYRPIYY